MIRTYPTAARLLAWSLSALLVGAEALLAEEGVLALHATDIKERPVEGAAFSTRGDGTLAYTDHSGRARIRLAPSTRPGSWVSLVVVPSKSGPDWTFISPWHQRVLVPPFANESENFVPIVLARRADRDLLTSDEAALAMAARVLEKLRPRVEGEEISEEERRAVLAEQAASFGLTPEEVDQAIRTWGARTKDPYEAGLAALYERNFSVAEERLSASLELREKRLQEAGSEVAEVAWFLGQARFEQGRYREAALAYQRAVEIWPHHAEVLDGLGMSLLSAGEAKTAEAPLREALALRETTLGLEHTDTIVSLSHTGLLAQELGLYEEAEALHRRAVDAAERNTTVSDWLRATLVNDLASLYFIQSRLDEAEPLFARSLIFMERAHGPNHPEVAGILGNLATTYSAQGRLAEAEPPLRRALTILEKTRGANHPDTVVCLSNLASLEHLRGNYAEAEELFRRVLEVSEKTLGRDHPDLARALENLATVQSAQGKYNDAETLARRALALRERVQGLNHPAVALPLGTLAQIFYDQGRYAEAESPLRQALNIQEKALGTDNTDLARLLFNLAIVYDKLDRQAEAVPLFERAIPMYEKTFGAEHPEMATVLSNLAESYREQGTLDRAESLARRALDIREKVLGPGHPDVAISLINLAAIQKSRGLFAESEGLSERALALLEKSFGADHPQVASALVSLANVRKELGRRDEAERLLMRALAIQEKALGDSPAVATSLSNLAELYRTGPDPSQAEPFYLRALKIREKILGPAHGRSEEVRRNYILFLRSQGRDTEADTLEARGQNSTIDSKATKPPGK